VRGGVSIADRAGPKSSPPTCAAGPIRKWNQIVVVRV
jgi:hypothetical protein